MNRSAAQDAFGISLPRTGMAVGFLAGRNGDVQQWRLAVTPEKHVAAMHLLKLVSLAWTERDLDSAGVLGARGELGQKLAPLCGSAGEASPQLG